MKVWSSGNHAAERHLGVENVYVWYWRMQYKKQKAAKKTCHCHAFQGSKDGKFSCVEGKVLEHVRNLEKEASAALHESVGSAMVPVTTTSREPPTDIEAGSRHDQKETSEQLGHSGADEADRVNQCG